MRDYICFTLNGKLIKLSGEKVFQPLSDTLRYHLQNTGTKVVCAEGDCGACTVMLSNSRESNLKFKSITSCIFPTFSADLCHLVTVEGLSNGSQLHEIQNSMIRNYGGQCGFCTPGFVMSILNMYENKKTPSVQNTKNYLTGNLCRCTGYQSIIESALDVNVDKITPVKNLYAFNEFDKEFSELINQSILIEEKGMKLFIPSRMDEALDFKNQYPSSRLISGGTDLGVQINKGRNFDKEYISLQLIKDLYEVNQNENILQIGSRVTLSQLQVYLEKIIPEFSSFLNIFASPQIKNSATVVGNIANGSPIGDTLPFLMCSNSKLKVASKDCTRVIELNNLFKGYKNLDIRSDEIITHLEIDLNEIKDFKISLYKASQRRDLDISSVNSCFFMKVDKNKKIEFARVAFGGIGPTPMRLFQLENELINLNIDSSFLDKIENKIKKSIQPISDIRGASEFRKNIAGSMFKKFISENYL